MSAKNGITYEILPEKDLEQTINCLVDVFTTFDDVEVLDFAAPYEVFAVTSELNNYEHLTFS